MSITWLTDVLKGCRQLLYPGECLACGVLLPIDRDHFCTSCEEAILNDPHHVCARCANTVGPHVDTTEGCLKCRSMSFHFDQVTRLGLYEGVLRDLILQMKHSEGALIAEALARIAATKMAPTLRTYEPTVVIPIPLHWWRKWERWYNQSEPFAWELATRLTIPCQPKWLRRIRATRHQTSLSQTARQENVLGAFQAHRSAPLKGETVLLVDDVMTTGATANQAARALHQAKAKRVIVAVLGHG